MFTGWIRYDCASAWTPIATCPHEWMAWVALGAIFRDFRDASHIEQAVLPEGMHPEGREIEA